VAVNRFNWIKDTATKDEFGVEEDVHYVNWLLSLLCPYLISVERTAAFYYQYGQT